jgi:putative colanic acid biosynthesis glycosyltransferase
MASSASSIDSTSRRAGIAVVTVCRNDLAGLKATAESVRAQTQPPSLWVVADGASTDGTREWLETIDWPLLRWSSCRDGGIYQGMNNGLAEVDAEYVLFLNSGDVFCDPAVLADVSEFLTRCTSLPSLLYGDSYEVDTQGLSYLRRARPPWWVWLGMPTTHQAMYFRRSSLPEGFDTRYRWSGDYDAVARLYMARRGADIAHLPRPICRFHLGGRSDQNRRSFLRENLDIRRRILGMSAPPAYVLHAAHHVQGWIKRYVPAVHRAIRYG